MEGCEVMNSHFYIIPPTNIWNELPSGAVQEIIGTFTTSGVWRPTGENYFIYLPYSKERVIRRLIDEILATNINWTLAFQDILKQWENNEVSSAELENYEILPLLVKVKILESKDGGFEIIEKYRMHYEQPQEDKVIDITEDANPRVEE